MTTSLMTRRELTKLLFAGAPMVLVLRASRAFAIPTEGTWTKYEENPVFGGQYGTCFDICLLFETGIYRMWVSWRPKQSIAITESKDGIHWGPPVIVLSPNYSTGWEDDINRPIVVHRDDGYHMWYTGQSKGRSKIGYAKSPDGRTWVRQSSIPVLEPTAPWEGVAVMCPHVMWNGASRVWKMWYSGGEQYEPNAIGYATSSDGLHWDRFSANPVLTPDPQYEWEKERVTAAQVIHWKGWYYAFYIGFRDVDHAQIGMARSKDGITGWVRHGENPIVRPSPGGWDADACYKPFTLYSNKIWRLWYNGRREHLEQIGLVIHKGEDLGFIAK